MLAAVKRKVAENLAPAFAEAANLNELGLEAEIQAAADQHDYKDIIRQVHVHGLNDF